MRFEPPVDRVRLLKAVREAYGIPAEELSFLPVGLGAACYELRTTGDARYFLKLWPQLRLEHPAAARQYASLVLTRALHDRGVGVCVPYPVPTRDGGLWSDLSGMPFAVSPLLPGTPPDSWPVALREELGRTIAALHSATPALADLPLPRETFDVAFEPALRRDLEAATQIGPHARPGLRATREWVLEHRGDILLQVERLHRLQVIVRGLDGPFVLCHTDLHPGNVLVDDNGHICLVDWDDAKMAPSEHDLWAGLGEDDRGASFGAFLNAYRRATGVAPLHLEHFAFYLLRRYVEDMAVNLRSLLDSDADEREDAALLRGMQDWGVARWSRLDDTLATVAAAL